MTFLSGETIRQRLGEFILNENGEPAGDHNQIDCNSYELRVGGEICITNSFGCSRNNPIISLHDGEAFKIPSGQFALILTDEIVHIPDNLMGFISIKSKKKLQGLINVSGFHIDPGWRGRLLYSVYNAGSNEIILRQGENLFLLWFAELGGNINNQYTKNNDIINNLNISPEYASHLSGQVYSPQTLNKRLDNIANKWWRKWYAIVGAIIVSLFAGMIGGVFLENYSLYNRDYKVHKEKIIKEVLDELKKDEKH